jgi:hypothetical protein
MDEWFILTIISRKYDAHPVRQASLANLAFLCSSAMPHWVPLLLVVARLGHPGAAWPVQGGGPGHGHGALCKSCSQMPDRPPGTICQEVTPRSEVDCRSAEFGDAPLL